MGAFLAANVKEVYEIFKNCITKGIKNINKADGASEDDELIIGGRNKPFHTCLKASIGRLIGSDFR